MTSNEFPIRSTFRNNLIITPIVFCFFVNLVAVCLFYPEKEKDPYPFNNFFIFLLCSILFFLIIAVINYLTKQKLIIDEKAIKYTNVFNKVKSEYLLVDIIDFKWSNKPYIVRKMRGPAISAKEEYIDVFFKDDRDINISGDEFENFLTIRDYLHDYCTDKKIIKIRPIEERKKSKYKH